MCDIVVSPCRGGFSAWWCDVPETVCLPVREEDGVGRIQQQIPFNVYWCYSLPGNVNLVMFTVL